MQAKFNQNVCLALNRRNGESIDFAFATNESRTNEASLVAIDQRWTMKVMVSQVYLNTHTHSQTNDEELEEWKTRKKRVGQQ